MPAPSSRSGFSGIALLAFGALGASAAFALEQSTGVNLTADEPFGARSQGFALVHGGFQQGADAVVNAPASMNDVNDFTFSTAHAEEFGLARFDNFAVLVPWHSDATMGLALSRYAVSGVENRPEGSPVAYDPEGLFSTSDWLVSGSFARRFGGFDVGGTMHLLYRQLDQTGWGLRGDAMAQYTFDRRFRFGTYVRGLVPSSAAWESGYSEYEAPEASLYAAGKWDLPYFYGQLQAGFETPGLLEPGARSAVRADGARGVTDPGSVLRTSKLGAEFNFDFGLSLRAGFNEIAPSAWASSVRLGMGYTWRNIVGVDYAFSTHSTLDQTHRVALRFTPSFPRFEGRDFRPRPAAARPSPELERRPSAPVPSESEKKDGAVAPSDSAQAPASQPAAPEKEELEDGEILEK